MQQKRTFGAETRLCAVIGNPVSHSLSPAIHNAAFEALGLDFVYIACRVEDLKGALEGMRSLGNFRGLSVTIPHKIEVMKHVDEIGEVDRSIGSINTVIREGEKLIGLGTDGPGALKALTDTGVDTTGRAILMLGAGGASRAISFTLAREGSPSEIILMDTNEAVLNGLAGDLKERAKTAVTPLPFGESNLDETMKRADIIIHCTPVGMHPKEEASLVPPHLFRPGQVVFDIVYTPLQTKLLREAAERGVKTISGVEMFINQAVLQFERFTGQKAPEEVMRRVVMERLSR